MGLIYNSFNNLNMKTKYRLLLVILLFLIVGIIAYVTIPFPKFEQISVLKLGLIPDDKTGVFFERLSAYNHYKYVHKGITFNDIPCYSNNGRKYVVDIKFNWDNTISISENAHKTTLHIDSIDYESSLSYGIGYLIDGEYVFEEVPEDAYFESISFYDSNQVYESIPYSVTIFRQKRTLPNGPHRYGFELYINKKLLRTGNKENEHIFEY